MSPDKASLQQATTNTLASDFLSNLVVEYPVHNLPTSPYNIIGREQELDVLKGLLKERHLINLVGPGGVGKSRLALQLAWDSLSSFPDGAWLVLLEGIDSPETLLPTIASALGFSFYGSNDPKSQLLDYLRSRCALLVLDNFEHITVAAPFLGEILQHAPQVHLLVTSRERLGLYEEHVFFLKGLQFPENEPVHELFGYSAVQFFVQCAARVRPDFSLYAQDTRWIVELCRQVDGLPLALELAAAWMRALPLNEIAQAIEDDIDFLRSPWRDAADRHHNLRVVCEHSWKLLTDVERVVCSQLSVFRGGIPRAAADPVAGATPVVLAGLVDKSFLHWEPTSKRYSLHPILRQYAEEKLNENGNQAMQVRDRHSHFYADFLYVRQGVLGRLGQSQALKAIGVEIENVRHAWEWMVKQARLDEVERALESLYVFFTTSRNYQDGLSLFSWTVQQGQSNWDTTNKQTQQFLWKLETRQGAFLFSVGKVKEAKDVFQHGLGVFQGTENLGEQGFCLRSLARIATFEGRLSEAMELSSEALSLARETRHRQEEATSLNGIGLIHSNQGNWIEAKQYFQQALEIFRQIGDCQGEGRVLHSFGLNCLSLEDFDGAIRCYQQLIDIFRQLEEPIWIEVGLDHIAMAYRALGDYSKAKACREQALALAQKLGNRNAEARILSNLGHIFLRLGLYAQAEEYFALALDIFRQTGRRIGEEIVLNNLSLIASKRKNYGLAHDYSLQALEIAKNYGRRSIKAHELTALAHALLGLGRFAEAAAAYLEALEIRRDLKQSNGAVECLGGLVSVELAQGNLQQAMVHTDECLQGLSGRMVGSDVDLFPVYLACYQVLNAVQDERTLDVLQTAYRLLQESAAKIIEEDLRHSFLENVPSHHEILLAYAEVMGEDTGSTTPSDTSTSIDNLTRRELDVLRLMADGLSDQEIAGQLVVKVSTIKTHAHHVYSKLGVRSRVQAVQRARELELL